MNSVTFCLLIAAIVFGLIGCNTSTDCPNCPPAPKSFSLRVEVKDSLGIQPVSGLRISGWTQLEMPGTSNDTLPPIIVSGTDIGFALPTRSYPSLAIYNYDGERVDSMDFGTRGAGVYSVHWDVPGGSPCGLFRTRLTVRRDTANDSVIYNSSIWMSHWLPDAEANVIGFTDARGVVQSGDSLSFPLFGSGYAMSRMDSSCNNAGPLVYRDTITLVLVDTVTNRLMFAQAPVKSGANVVRVNWHGRPAAVIGQGIGRGRSEVVRRSNLLKPDSVLPKYFELNQNCPNPF